MYIKSNFELRINLSSKCPCITGYLYRGKGQSFLEWGLPFAPAAWPFTSRRHDLQCSRKMRVDFTAVGRGVLKIWWLAPFALWYIQGKREGAAEAREAWPIIRIMGYGVWQPERKVFQLDNSLGCWVSCMFLVLEERSWPSSCPE
jgi:hypothetical protein